MVYFNCDYMAGAHPDVLKALCDTNLLKTPGYGFDTFTEQAQDLILKECGLDAGKVCFLQGGTQTNKVVIDRLLSRNDGVICCDTAHINVHEAGAIEADGHKVIPLPGKNGKLEAHHLLKYMEDFYRDETNEHMVRPAMVYISHPTELGTLYSLSELCELSNLCKKYGMPLFIDGARLAYALASPATDVTLHDIAMLADVFYIGGTKCGAMFGEAVVTRNPRLLPRFMSLVKLHGALLAKGRLLAIQFLTLFTDNPSTKNDNPTATPCIGNANPTATLYMRIGQHADTLAMTLKEGLIARGYRQLIDSPTNQQFFIMPNRVIDRLSAEVGFELWGPRGEKESAVRFVTDWSTTPEDVTTLLTLLDHSATGNKC